MSPVTRSVATRGIVGVLALAVALGVVSAATFAQQVPDRAFDPPVPRPVWPAADGPRLCVDAAHFNFHTIDNRFWVFGELARRDGFRVTSANAVFSAASLAACEVLVISNAQPSGDPWSSYPYPTPSAFTAAEIAAVTAWVRGGGRLLLIADHMPLAGAAAALAAAFGADFVDGFALKGVAADRSAAAIQAARGAPTLFRREEGTLVAHAITEGRDPSERLTQVRSFTGQAFRWGSPDVHPVMRLPADFVSLEPRIAWQFDSTTHARAVGGWLQGATRRAGTGRVALFGEAAMFSAQRSGGALMGMNAPMAEQNAQFVLNVLHWLSGVLEP